MNQSTAVLVLGLGTFAACGDDTNLTGENPPVLWLALDGRQTEVRLVATEPTPY